MSTDSIIAETKALVQTCLADGKLDSGELLKIGIFVAQQVNRLKELKGAEKKALVLRAVEEAVNTVVPAEGSLREVSKTALQVLPTVLDIAVSAANGQLALGKLKKSDFLGCLLGCFRVAAVANPSAAPVLAHVSQAVEAAAKVAGVVAAPPAENPADDSVSPHPPAEQIAGRLATVVEEPVAEAPPTELTIQEEETRHPSAVSQEESRNVESEKEPNPEALLSKSL